MVFAQEEEDDEEELQIAMLEVSGQCEISVNPKLTSQQMSQLKDVLKEVDAIIRDMPGRTSKIAHHINTGDSPPICLPPYRVPVAASQGNLGYA